MKKLLFIFLFLQTYLVHAQDIYKYWIAFNDKDTTTFKLAAPEKYLSQKAIERRAKYGVRIDMHDIPVNEKYVDTIALTGVDVHNKSKWLNGVTIFTPDKSKAAQIKQFAFVKEVRYVGYEKQKRETGKEVKDLNEMLSVLEQKFSKDEPKQADSMFYGKAAKQLQMLNGHKLHEKGFLGQRITIAVIDAGFKNANKLASFANVYDEGRVLGTRDFVENNILVYEDDDHGMAVWGCMSAYAPYKYVGTAPKADYWLLRSEQAEIEYPVEETYWATAAEFADSVGVDLINSSLGYNEFIDHSLDHTQKELDGKTALISKAAAIAAGRGMVVVNSAGNEGDEEWKLIGVPADVQEVITVGGVDNKGHYAYFSSTGLTSDKRIKPDVVALGESAWVASQYGTFYEGNGTSYASPILAGVIACLMQANDSADGKAIADALRLSGSQYNQPDRYLGYGIPDAWLANKILGGDSSFVLNKDQLLDARMLDDKQLHITFHTASKQKISITVTDEYGKVWVKDTEAFKQHGVYRFGLKKTKKLKRGVYAVSVISAGETFRHRLVID